MRTNTHPILVVGGAGYIGSHMLLVLKKAGYEPIVLDDLSNGHAEAVLEAKLIVGNIADSALLDEVFSTYQFAAVMHFASFIEVNESIKNPLKYYQNNVGATLTLLQAMIKHNVNKFIFSSTAAVYGEPEYLPIDEAHPTNPVNPYGRSKLMVEEILADLAKSNGLSFTSLRYFNAAGADPEGRLKERHEPETHLIPRVLQVALGKREAITVYGEDFSTADGTCVRDYVHVMDLCEAHLLALKALLDGSPSTIYNLGVGNGYSVQEVIDVARAITQHPIAVLEGEKREGDPACLIANPHKAKHDLHWHLQYPDLDTIIRHAWDVMEK